MLSYEKLFGQLEEQLSESMTRKNAVALVQQVAKALHITEWEAAPDRDKWEDAERSVQELAEDVLEMYNDGHILPSQLKEGLESINILARTLKLPIKAEVPADAEDLLRRRRAVPQGNDYDGSYPENGSYPEDGDSYL